MCVRGHHIRVMGKERCAERERLLETRPIMMSRHGLLAVPFLGARAGEDAVERIA
jgi:hypothetical protein